MPTTRPGTASFDHGAQYVTTRSSAFQKYIEELAGSGYAARWTPKATIGEGTGQMLPWYVGIPRMCSLGP
jgi:predicted NAD/FAD-dependent oxidoreductase